MKLTNILIDIQTSYSQKETLPIHTGTKGKDIVNKLLESMNIKTTGFQLYLSLDERDILIGEDMFMLDLFSLYAEQLETEPYSFVLRKQLFKLSDLTGCDPKEKGILLAQAIKNYLLGIYNFDLNNRMMATAILLQLKYGDDKLLLKDRGSYAQLIEPLAQVSDGNNNEFFHGAEAAFFELEGTEEEECIQLFLHLMQSCPMYGSEFFLLEQTYTSDLPKYVTLAIHPNGIFVTGPKRELYFKIGYDSIVECVPTEKSILIITDSIVNGKKCMH